MNNARCMYSKNPYLPKVRAQAVNMVKQGSGIRQVARYIGVQPSTVSRWVKRAGPGKYHKHIPTNSSRPKLHPSTLGTDIVKRIIELRLETNGRCAEVIHQMLINEGITVSLSSVKRTLERNYLIKKRNPWKRYHESEKRPFVTSPGALVQIDTIHLMLTKTKRMYV